MVIVGVVAVQFSYLKTATTTFVRAVSGEVFWFGTKAGDMKCFSLTQALGLRGIRAPASHGYHPKRGRNCILHFVA